MLYSQVFAKPFALYLSLRIAPVVCAADQVLSVQTLTPRGLLRHVLFLTLDGKQISSLPLQKTGENNLKTGTPNEIFQNSTVSACAMER